MKGHRILVVDDEESLRRVTQLRLQQAGHEAMTAADGAEALSLLASTPLDLVITDLKMPGMSGLELLRRIKEEHPEVMVVVFTAFGTIESAVVAMREGAFDYLIKPVNADALQLVIARALEHRMLREQVSALRSVIDRKYGFESILGQSKALLSVIEHAGRAARSDATLLIKGETGTGKELLARAIHWNSPRREAPFLVINCGAIPRELLESELFGHTKGAFTGALAHKKGKIELAGGGTLFLDEIGEMPTELQVKLLRLIQEKEIEKVGAARPVKVDVRIIAATHRDLPALIAEGAFREDLYYRLNVIPLELPPLRERPEDIGELAVYFFERCKERQKRPGLRLPPALLPFLVNYRWPGNVRELENAMERMVVLAQGDELTVDDLPEPLRRGQSPLAAIQLELPPGGINIDELERELLRQALDRAGGNQTRAAGFLGLTRKTFLYRMEKHGLRGE